MANIVDYLYWRGDLRLRDNPLNEIDAAIIARLAYMRYEKITLLSGETLFSILTRIISLPDAKTTELIKGDLPLMRAVIKTLRFSSFVVLSYENEINDETQTQFSSLTLLEKDTNTLFISFRGTDNTLIGWKEDFNMAFESPLPGQIKAKEYLEKMSEKVEAKIVVTGHSKGGNFALYASSFCKEEVQNRIERVYNFDGPGFDSDTIKEEGYRRICPKISTFVPQSSVIGMLLEHEEKYTIVHSLNQGLMQHDIYSWILCGTYFITLKAVTNTSLFVDYTLKQWLKSMSKEERETLIDGIYSVIRESNATTFRELKENWFESGKEMLKATRKFDNSTKKTIAFAISRLLKSSTSALSEIISVKK